LAQASWGIGQVADCSIRAAEELLERAVSSYIGKMSVLWLAVGDEPGPTSDRAYLERNLLGLLVGPTGAIDRPSPKWLGLASPNERIRQSGMWNLDFLEYSYSPEFLSILAEYVAVTLEECPSPKVSIAPESWYRRPNRPDQLNQLKLFED
jgi:hypothetical protein